MSQETTPMANPRQGRAPAPRCQGDEGSVFAEFALILPVLATLLLGMVEMGVLFRQQTEFATFVQLASRTASQAAKSRGADQSILTAVRAGMGGLENTTITKVIIYNADSATKPSAACLATTPNPTTGAGQNNTTSDCNVYNLAQINAATSAANFTNTCSTFATSTVAWDKWYCPTNRRDTLVSSPSLVGVYVEADYAPVTKLFGTGPRKLTENAVYQVEVLS
jgi:Flp pilus assembly protein TadG